MLSFRNVSFTIGSKVLFTDVNLQLYVGQKVGVIGQNGSGKTSLFKLILGINHVDVGDLSISNNAHIAYVEQEIHDVDLSITEYVLNAHPMIKAEQIDLPEYYQLRPYAEKLLINLGFSQSELGLPLNNFSGGWQMRVNLAKALFVPSDLLLLDEPTNHLDVETVIWLEDWLKRYNGLALIISHDREFLDNITTHTLSLSNKLLTLYTGNYSQFERIKAEQILQKQQLDTKNQARVKHLQSFVDRFKAKASKAKQAQSRMKMIEKIEVAQNIPKDIEYSIEFLEPVYQVDKLISISNAEIGYPDKLLIKNAKLDIFNHSRIGLLGRNGIGKSTLIKAFIDGGTLISGLREINPKIKVGYFAQHTIDGLDFEDTPLSMFIREHKNKKESELRSYLGRYGFNNDKVYERIGNFSGGEKARLSIANIILNCPNILFLDEPTNHLDMQMREELAYSIQDFLGAVVIVSHDKFLLSSVVDEFYLINNEELKLFSGDLEDYHQFLLTKESGDNQKNNKLQQNKSTKNIPRLKNSLDKLNQKIKKIELDIDKIEQELTLVDITTRDVLTQQLNKHREKLASAEDEWLLLEHELNS